MHFNTYNSSPDALGTPKEILFSKFKRLSREHSLALVPTVKLKCQPFFLIVSWEFCSVIGQSIHVLRQKHSMDKGLVFYLFRLCSISFTHRRDPSTLIRFLANALGFFCQFSGIYRFYDTSNTKNIAFGLQMGVQLRFQSYGEQSNVSTIRSLIHAISLAVYWHCKLFSDWSMATLATAVFDTLIQRRIQVCC